jgi:hypothetical protein
LVGQDIIEHTSTFVVSETSETVIVEKAQETIKEKYAMRFTKLEKLSLVYFKVV